MHHTNTTTNRKLFVAAVRLHHDAATCGVDFYGNQKTNARGIEPRAFGVLITPDFRGPRGAINTARATCMEGSKDAHAYQSDGNSLPGQRHNHTSAGRG